LRSDLNKSALKSGLLQYKNEIREMASWCRRTGCSTESLANKTNAILADVEALCTTADERDAEWCAKAASYKSIVSQPLPQGQYHALLYTPTRTEAPSLRAKADDVACRLMENTPKSTPKSGLLEPKNWQGATLMTAGALSLGKLGDHIEEKIVDRSAEKASKQWVKSHSKTVSSRAALTTLKQDLKFAQKIHADTAGRVSNQAEQFVQHLVTKAEADVQKGAARLALAKETEVAASKAMQHATTYAASGKVAGKIVGGLLGAVGGNILSELLSPSEAH